MRERREQAEGGGEGKYMYMYVYTPIPKLTVFLSTAGVFLRVHVLYM